MPPAFALNKYPLLFITDRHRSGGRSNVDVIRAVLEGGGRWIMYREPDLTDREFYAECLQVRELCEHVGAGLIVNDRLDIAAMVQADGVHLGANDLPVRVVKEYMGEDFLVGYSAHTEKEALTISWEGADYLTYSPIFNLDHKDSPYQPHGIKGAKAIVEKISIPVFLLGGLRLHHLEEMRNQIPNFKMAGVSFLADADDITAATEQAIHLLGAPVPEPEEKTFKLPE